MTRTLQLVTTIVVLLFSVVAYGQENTVRTVSGTVQDERGIPLPGVTIIEKGSSNSTASNEQGVFAIKVKQNATLVFKSIGFTIREITPGSRNELIVTMKEDVQQLADVVVVGYGTQKKQAITGAVVTADLKTYEKVPVNNIMETLKGTVAGLNIGDANKAGAAPGYSIRGTSTFAKGGAAAPLLVLDGTVFNGSIADIAPSDIESITILKDASAAAVYGSRSGNGVILIESKKGSSINGKPTFNFNTSYGTSSELKRLKVYDAQGYMQRLNDILNDAGTVVTPELTSNYLQAIEKANYNATPDHQATLADPYSLFRQNGSNAKTSLSVSQRTDKMSYYLAGSMTDQKGVIVNDKFKQYTLRLNLESNVTNWLTLGIKSYYSYRDYPGARIYGNAGNNGSSSYLISPFANVKNADGSYIMFPQTTTSFVNPFLMRPTEAYDRSNNLNAILYGTVKLPWVDGLSYTATYSKTNNTGESGSFYNKLTNDGISVNGKGSNNFSRANATLLDHMVKYNKTIAGLHNIDLTLLYSDQKNRNIGDSLSAQGFDNDQLMNNRLQAGTTQSVRTGARESEQLGQMARLTYSYNQKYSVTGTFRRDGYSAFSANHKYGNFGSVGANWTISNENFMKNVSAVNSLALRISYGSNGNQTISPYQTLPKIGNNYYFYQGDNNYTYTQGISNLGNDDLLWESTVGFNGGIDFSVLNNRISGSVDAYLTKTHNLAFPLTLPQASGFSTITANAGEIANKGIELNLKTVNIQKDKFNWTSNVAFSLNRNKFNHLLGDRNGDGVEDDIVSSNQFIGKSMSTVYGYKVIGMWQQADKDNGTIMAGFAPGTYKLQDVNGDGKITTDADRMFLGDGNANFRWSLANTFSYSNFSLLVYLNSTWGGNGYFINGENTPQSDPYAANGAMNHPVYDYWTPTNTNAEFPRPSFASKAAASAPKYYDRSFIQLQKIAFGYDASKYFKKYGVNGVNLSISADNLGTYAPHWLGLDPATGKEGGLTVSSIPSLRTLTANLNINF